MEPDLFLPLSLAATAGPKHAAVSWDCVCSSHPSGEPLGCFSCLCSEHPWRCPGHPWMWRSVPCAGGRVGIGHRMGFPSPRAPSPAALPSAVLSSGVPGSGGSHRAVIGCCCAQLSSVKAAVMWRFVTFLSMNQVVFPQSSPFKVPETFPLLGKTTPLALLSMHFSSFVWKLEISTCRKWGFV